jgi:hypothetical protein
MNECDYYYFDNDTALKKWIKNLNSSSFLILDKDKVKYTMLVKNTTLSHQTSTGHFKITWNDTHFIITKKHAMFLDKMNQTDEKYVFVLRQTSINPLEESSVYDVCFIRSIDDDTEIFTASWHSEIILMTYLKCKYKDQCIAVPLKLKHMVGTITNYDIDKGRFMIWDLDNNELNVSDDFLSIVCEGRFIIFHLLIRNSKRSHINSMLFDMEEKTMERFESFGKSDMGISVEQINSMNDEINSYCSLHGCKYVPTSNSCPNFQGIQQKEQEWTKIKYKNISGYCIAWSTWYIDLRFSNPSYNKDKILNIMNDTFKKNPGKITKYISAYADNIIKLKTSIIKYITDFPYDEWGHNICGSIDMTSINNNLKIDKNNNITRVQDNGPVSLMDID